MVTNVGSIFKEIFGVDGGDILGANHKSEPGTIRLVLETPQVMKLLSGETLTFRALGKTFLVSIDK